MHTSLHCLFKLLFLLLHVILRAFCQYLLKRLLRFRCLAALKGAERDPELIALRLREIVFRGTWKASAYDENSESALYDTVEEGTQIELSHDFRSWRRSEAV